MSVLARQASALRTAIASSHLPPSIIVFPFPATLGLSTDERRATPATLIYGRLPPATSSSRRRLFAKAYAMLVANKQPPTTFLSYLPVDENVIVAKANANANANAIRSTKRPRLAADRAAIVVPRRLRLRFVFFSRFERTKVSTSCFHL